MVHGAPRSSHEYAVRVLMDLISIPTVSPDGSHYGEAASLLERELSRFTDEVEVVEVPRAYQREKCKGASENPRYIVIARLGSGQKTLHYNGHYDVVPGGQGWTVTDPFKPVVRDGRLYGRGAIDMKGGIAAVLGALHAMAETGRGPVHRVEVAFVPDEEIGGECGTGYLVEEVYKGRPPEYVVIPEPSGLERPWHGHKGVLWAKVTVRGVNAHGSTPWRGRNAFLLASRLALKLQDLYTPVVSQRKSKYPTVPEESMYPTFMIGGEAGVPGGGKTNQIPGEFYFTIDRRLIPEESLDAVRDEIEALVRYAAIGLGLSQEDYRVEYTASMEPAINEPGELLTALKNAGRLAGVEVGDPVVCPGGLDLHYYTAKGSKALSYGPQGGTAHAPDEYIELEELEKLVDIFYLLSSEPKAWTT